MSVEVDDTAAVGYRTWTWFDRDVALRSLAYHGLLPHGTDTALRVALGTQYESRLLDARAGALRASVEAGYVSRLLASEGIQHVVLKGPTLAEPLGRNDRTFTDLDLLVRPADAPRAIRCLREAAGARHLDEHRWPRRDGVAELPLSMPSGVVLDVHWDLVHHERVRGSFRLDVDELLDRARAVRILGQEVRCLDACDQILHVALHAALSGGHRLLWLHDLHALLNQPDVDWAELVTRAQQSGTALVLAVMLDRARRVLGTSVDARTWPALTARGRVWLALVAVFDWAMPMTRPPERARRGQLLLRATRDSTASSLREFLRLALQECNAQ